VTDADPTPRPHPGATVAVCTRDRGDKIVATIESLLADRGDGTGAVEIVVVDQSSGDETRAALERFLPLDGVRYVPTTTTGLSRARNIALAMAQSDLVLFTDDDCVVEPGWIAANVQALRGPEAPAIVFGDVAPAADDEPGYAPESVADRDFVVTSMRGWRAPDGVNVGIGASMAVRRSLVQAAGGFDECLGAGAVLHSAEDTDISVRMLIAGHTIVRTRAARVAHYGAREHESFRVLTRRAMFGVGAVIGKALRARPLLGLRFATSVGWRLVVRPTLSSLARGRKPPVLGRAVNLAKGTWRGLRTPLERPALRFAGE
jgi:GT2 family glycosyltransferase